MGKPLRVLIIEDSEDDARIILRELERGGHDPVSKQVETLEAMSSALKEGTWDIVISDYTMPHFSAPAALKLLQESGLDLPFIIVTGTVGEETAVEVMKSGAHDYVMKSNLKRLVPAIERELHEAEVRHQKKQAEENVRQTAEEWRMTFDSITDLVSIHGKDFKLVRVNKAFADTVKMKPQELIGKTCYQVIHGRTEPVFSCPYKKMLETKEPACGDFFESHLGLHLEVATSPILNDKGEVVACVHVARDITERKKMQAQLMAQDRLVTIGQLTSGIAHELNNPLTGVIGFSELLLGRDLPEDVKEDLVTINSEAKRTANVVKGLLTFARKQKTEKALVDINSIIQGVLQLRSYEQRVSNIEVDTRFATDLPQVLGNGAQLQQVFLNIIINAEQAMLEAHGRGKLTIATGRVRDIVRASVTDDGPGISPENMRKLFTPFFTTKEVGKGTGLGLSICHGIVTEHSGKIYAESELGKGATFIMELPISK